MFRVCFVRSSAFLPLSSFNTDLEKRQGIVVSAFKSLISYKRKAGLLLWKFYEFLKQMTCSPQQQSLSTIKV